MRAHNFIFLFKQGAKNVFSNKLMSFAGIGVLIACFLLIGSAVLFTFSVNNIAGYIGDRNEVVVFLENNLTKSDIEIIDLEIRGIGNIEDVKYYSVKDNLERISEMLGETPETLLNNPDADNPFRASYEMRISNPAVFQQTVKKLESIEGVTRVEGSSDVAKTLVAIQTAVMYGGVGIVVILIIVSTVIIANTIKLTVFSRRREINIMKYVGATDSFIRLPFLVEGMLIGIIAASTAFFILGFAYTYLLTWLSENYQADFIIGAFLDNAVNFKSIAIQLFGGFAAIGCFIGVLGSGFFVRKYLKV